MYLVILIATVVVFKKPFSTKWDVQSGHSPSPSRCSPHSSGDGEISETHQGREKHKIISLRQNHLLDKQILLILATSISVSLVCF